MSRRRRCAAVCTAKAATSIEQAQALMANGELDGEAMDTVGVLSDEFADKLNRIVIDGNETDDD